MRGTPKQKAMAEWERQGLDPYAAEIEAAMIRQKVEILPRLGLKFWPRMEDWLRYRMWEITDVEKFRAVVMFIYHDSKSVDDAS